MIVSQNVEQPVVIERNAELSETHDQEQNDEEEDDSVTRRYNETSGEENAH